MRYNNLHGKVITRNSSSKQTTFLPEKEHTDKLNVNLQFLSV